MDSNTAYKNDADRLQVVKSLEILDTPSCHNFDKITKLATLIFDVPIAGISIIDQNRIWFKSIEGLSFQEIERNLFFCNLILDINSSELIIPDLTTDKRTNNNILVKEFPNLKFYASFALSIKKNDYKYKIGTLFILDYEPREFDKKKIACLKYLAEFALDEIISNMQNNLINYENQLLCSELSKLKYLAAIDNLTQLWNRTAILKCFDTLKTRALKNNREFALGIIDIDNFKNINDQYGHNAGDLVLRTVASILIKSTRKVDIVGRWGGDEFVVFLDTNDGNKMKKIFNRISQNIKKLNIKYKKDHILLSVTIGVSIFEPNDIKKCADFQALLDAADHCLYQGKKVGKIGNVIYSSNIN